MWQISFSFAMLNGNFGIPRKYQLKSWVSVHSVTFDIFLRSWQSAGSNQSLIDMKHFMDICYRLDKKLHILIMAGFEQVNFEL